MKALIYPVLIFISNSVLAQSDFDPKYSPDGSRISYYSYIDGIPEIMVMNSDGTNKQQLTPRTGNWSIGASWLSEGGKIIFSYGADMSVLDIAVIDINSKEISIAEKAGSQFSLGQTSKGVMWASKAENSTTFYSATNYFAHHEEGVRISGFENYWIYPVPGSNDLIMSVSDEGKEGLYKIPEGKEPMKILDAKNARNLVYSRDLTKIAFEMKVDDNDDIYISDIDGSNLKRVTENEYPDYMPDFSADGEKIVFSSARSGKFCLYQIDLNTMKIKQLTGPTSQSD